MHSFLRVYHFLCQFFTLLYARYCEALVRPRIAIRSVSEGQWHCLNCGTIFQGNFCPMCGQNATVRRFRWREIGHGVLQLFGWSERSIPRTLWHLIYRPGYMIGDYLAGRRMPYFPPIRLLFVLAASVVLLSNITPEREAVNEPVFTFTTSDSTATSAKSLDKEESFTAEEISFLKQFEQRYFAWARDHKALELLLIHSLIALAGWRIFRKTRRNAYLTLPEHFYVQVYIACQLLFLRLLYILFSFQHVDLKDTYGMPFEIICLVLLYDYRQLFGDSWPRLLWRMLLFLLLFFFMAFMIGLFVGAFSAWRAFDVN